MEKRNMIKYWTETTHWAGTNDTPTPPILETPPPASTADPNSLGELMRYAIFLPGDSFPYDPKTLIKTD